MHKEESRHSDCHIRQGQLWEFPLSANYYIGERHIILIRRRNPSEPRSQWYERREEHRFDHGSINDAQRAHRTIRPIWPSFIADAGWN